MPTQVSDNFRDTGEFTCQIPALPRPTLKELQEKFYCIKSQEKFPWIKSIERDTSATEAVTLQLGMVLSMDEKPIKKSKSEYERRIAPLTGPLGYQHLEWLVEHQDEHPAFKALPEQVYIVGPGLIVMGVNGQQSASYIDRSGGRWYLNWCWLGGDFGDGGDFIRDGRVAVSGK